MNGSTRSTPQDRAAAFLQQFEERKRLGRSSVDLSTHTRFGIALRTFREFALRNADAFRGRAAYAVTPA